MRLGISPFASTRDGAVRLARAAIDGGLDTLWLGDGLLANPDFPGWSGSLEPFAELAWLDGAVQPARIGLSAAVLPIRDIVNVAKQAATLDVITEGGFVLAVAPGYWPGEFAFRGVPIEQRGRRFDDAVDALRALWRGEPHEGPYISIPTGGVVSPIPFTSGGPPLWLAGGRPTMERALRLGLPFQPSRALPDALEPIAREWFDRGGGPLGVRIRVETGDTIPAGHQVDWQALAGPPAFLAEQFGRYQAMGVSDISVVPGQSDAVSMRTVEALAEHVVPALGRA